ncbi:MAG: nitroreductase/quinone reductase family protein [Microthrixaceae bacterium]
MAGDSTFKVLNSLHRMTLKVTGGRFGWKLRGMQVVELTTVGRRSGEQRTVMLTSPLTDGDAIVVVASRGGDDHHPAWYLNLLANPEVSVSLRGRSVVPMTARVASETERKSLWPRIVAAYKPYAGYQEKSTRQIPVVLLEAR